ncbi:uncharacterized protein N7484_010328 [Penicillium longicatenatum]|uniref:uncharacterized protein n=1 Tax=Penicillium longicatenatum TaxID=1561947 RepID=UPI002546ACDF|nr:uncharacterized protein N7484_010328 [Penicillium longicatenatum]KAJ5630228.1 hypothetical protein N7484_010328 [Penicillium longicatenatum]
MPAMFRRTSDFFKHFNQRHDSVHSDKPVLESHNSSARSSHADLTVESTPLAPADTPHPKKQRLWSFGHQDEDEREKRRLEREERERADFAATRRYASARRRSNGAGIGFEGGWQG